MHLIDLSPSVSSASARTSQRTPSVSVMLVVRWFFGLSSNLTENRVCFSYASVAILLRPQFVPHREQYLSQLCICRQMFLRPQFEPHREHGVSQLCICRQMFLRPQFEPHREHGLSQLCMSSAVSSAAVRTSQRTPRVSVLYQSSGVTWALARTLQGRSLSLL